MIKYSDYAEIFLTNLVIKLPENISINKYAIKLINKKQPLYRPIYILSLVELKILKTYIKTYLKIGFIRSCKSLTDIFIFFDKKLDNNFCLYVNYQGLNNLMI